MASAQKPDKEREIRLRPKKGNNDTIRMRFADPSYLQAVNSGKPEAVVKVASQARGHRVNMVMQYVARSDQDLKDKDLAIEDEAGNIHKGEKEIKRIYDDWKKDFERAKPGKKNPPRHVTHIILSGKCENTDRNARKVLAAARETIKEHIYAKGYRFIAVMHRDTPNPHVHFVVKNYNENESKRKLRLNPPELFELRQSFAKRMSELGLEQVATVKLDREERLKRVFNGIEKIKEKDTWMESKLKTASPSVDVFAYRKQQIRTIGKLNQEIKKTTLPGSKERKLLMKATRELTEKIITPGSDIKKEIEATTRKFGKDLDKFNSYIKELKEPSIETPKMTPVQQLTRRRTLEKEGNKIASEITEAKRSIVALPIPMEKKQTALAALKQHERAVLRTIGRELGR